MSIFKRYAQIGWKELKVGDLMLFNAEERKIVSIVQTPARADADGPTDAYTVVNFEILPGRHSSVLLPFHSVFDTVPIVARSFGTLHHMDDGTWHVVDRGANGKLWAVAVGDTPGEAAGTAERFHGILLK